MFATTDAFVIGLAFYARRRGLPARYDVAMIDEALAEAARLAAGREIDEPAALFYACARRSRAFAGAAEQIVPFATRRHAETVGLQLSLDDLVLSILRARILYDAITWEELRAEFAAKLTPRGA
jgi:hypothetical protein